jgi:hypothetical protein
MAFRETVRSMRAYFIVVGILGGLSDINTLKEAGDEPLIMAAAGLGLLIAVAFLYCGAMLPGLLKDKPKVVNTVLYLTLASSAAGGLLLLAAGVNETGPWVSVVVGVVIALYLLANVKRLHEELNSKVEPEVFE